MATLVNDREGLVLRVLGDGEWRTPVEVAREAGFPTSGFARELLHSLAGEGLVERGGWGTSNAWGHWRITEAGVRAVGNPNQMGFEQALGEGRR